MGHCIARATDGQFIDVEGVPGLRWSLSVGRDHGAAHLEVTVYEPALGRTTGWAARCPFEESWFIRAKTSRLPLSDCATGSRRRAPGFRSVVKRTLGLLWPQLRARIRAVRLPRSRSGWFCCSMCRFMMLSGAPLTYPVNYELGQRCCARQWWWTRSGSSWWSLGEDTPLREFTSLVTAPFGGRFTSRWTWLASPLNSTSSTRKSTEAYRGCED